MSEADRQLQSLSEAAQQAAAVLAARHRGDPAGVAALMGSFASDRAMAGGLLLLADLTLRLYGEQRKLSTEQCLQELCLQLAETTEALS